MTRHHGFGGTDLLYVTTRRHRRDFFYCTANADPEMIGVDEKLKQTAGLFEMPTAIPYMVDGVSRTTRIPVLSVLGDRDRFFAGRGGADCSSDAALAAFERRFYDARATIEAAITRTRATT